MYPYNCFQLEFSNIFKGCKSISLMLRLYPTLEIIKTSRQDNSIEYSQGKINHTSANLPVYATIFPVRKLPKMEGKILYRKGRQKVNEQS
jgi:hypothetical protein